MSCTASGAPNSSRTAARIRMARSLRAERRARLGLAASLQLGLRLGLGLREHDAHRLALHAPWAARALRDDADAVAAAPRRHPRHRVRPALERQPAIERHAPAA